MTKSTAVFAFAAGELRSLEHLDARLLDDIGIPVETKRAILATNGGLRRPRWLTVGATLGLARL